MELHSLFIFSRNDPWNCNILMCTVSDQLPTSSAETNSSFQILLAKSICTQTGPVCLIPFAMKSLLMGCECAARYFSIMKCNTTDWAAAHWQILRHIWMLTFSSSLLLLLQDQQKQKMQQVLNTDKPELWPGRDSYSDLLLGAFS